MIETIPKTDEPTATDAAPTFCIDSEETANWYLRRLASLESEKQRVTAQAACIVKQLEADASRLRYLFDSQLQNFARQTLAASGNRRKSLTLLQGTVSFRIIPASVKIADVDAALDYARQSQQDAVRTQDALDTARYREAAQAALQNGELLPGVETVPESETFRITFGKPA